MGPILPEFLGELVHKTGGRGGGGRSRGGGGSATADKRNPPPREGGARVRVRYDVHLSALSLQDRENSHSILAGQSSRTCTMPF